MEFDRNALLKTFLAESADNLSALEAGALRLEEDPSDREHVDTLFRCAHTLKGNAESIGCDGIAEMAHSLENLLDGVRSRAIQVTAELVNEMLGAADAIAAMLREVSREVEGASHRSEPDVFAERTLRVNLEQVEKVVALTG